MCGILGVVMCDDRQPPDPDLFGRMCDTLVHRGPDDRGIRHFRTAAIGMRRLSIIDIAGGQQPISDAAGSRWIVLNGEIYNYRELRRMLETKGRTFRTRSDTEVVLQAYAEFGERCVEYLRGMFAFAIWDDADRRLFLARDRLGIKPLFVYEDDRRLIFASEIKAILADPSVKRTLDAAALKQYLSLLYVPAPLTGFAGIRKLPPGTCATFRDGVLRTSEYWDVRPASEFGDAPQPGADEVAAALSEAVGYHLVSDVPVGAFLSGGLDSSTVVALAAARTEQPLETYTMGFESGPFDESAAARETAAACGTQHYEDRIGRAALDVDVVNRVLGHLDEPFADSSVLPTYHISALAARHAKVVLSGDGGDELFCGYPHQRNFLRARRLRPLAHSALGRGLLAMADHLGPGLARGRLRRPIKALGLGALNDDDLMIGVKIYFSDADKERILSPELSRATADVRLADAFEPYLSRSRGWRPLERLMYLDLRTTLPDDMLTKVDRMSMLHSLEARVPLLDHHLVELAFRIDPERNLQHPLGKAVFREAAARVVPRHVLARPKRGFEIPLDRAVNPRFREFTREVLNRATVADAGCFRWQEVSALIEAFEGRGAPGATGLSRYQINLRFWSVLTWHAWAKTWLGVGR